MTALTPAPLTSTIEPGPTHDLDTIDELASRSLLLGIVYRTLGNYAESQKHLNDAIAKQPLIKINTWVPGVALFESAVCDLREQEESGNVGKWNEVLIEAEKKLDRALVGSGNVDLGSRLDSRIALQKDEMQRKREMLQAAEAPAA